MSYTEAVESSRAMTAKDYERHAELRQSWAENPDGMPSWLRTPIPKLYVRYVQSAYELPDTGIWQCFLHYRDRAGWYRFRGPAMHNLGNLVSWIHSVFPGLPLHMDKMLKEY